MASLRRSHVIIRSPMRITPPDWMWRSWDGVGDRARVLAAGAARADLVITRANIWTGNPVQPEAKAPRDLGDRIVEVGGAERDRSLARPGIPTVIDAGPPLLPGFNDAHVHFMDGGPSSTTST
jgi:hypothetical protein